LLRAHFLKPHGGKKIWNVILKIWNVIFFHVNRWFSFCHLSAASALSKEMIAKAAEAQMGRHKDE
jgi:hypothetical protein